MKIIPMVKKGFEVGAKNINLVVLLIVINLVITALSFLFGFGSSLPRPIEEINLFPIISFAAIVAILGLFIQAGVLGIVRDFVKWGEKVVISKFFVFYAKKYFLRLLGLGALMVAVILLILVAFGALGSLFILIAGQGIGNIIAVLFLSVGFLGVLVALVYLFPAYFIIIVEEIGVIQAIRSSISFVKENLGSVLKLLGIWVLIYLGISIVVGLISLAFNNIGSIVVQRLIGGVINGVIGSYIMVCITGSWINFYLALKMAAPAEE